MNDKFWLDFAQQKNKELVEENVLLREALTRARQFAHNKGLTMREFARELGITGTQLSKWTDSTPDEEPDFRD